MRKEKLRTFAFAMALLMAFSSMDVTAYAADMQNGYAEETTLDTGNTVTDWEEQEELPLMEADIISDELGDVEKDGEAIPEYIINSKEQESDILFGEVLTEDAASDAEFSAIETEDTLVNSDYGLSNPRKDANGNTVWDCIEFGHYLQEDTNGDGIVDENDEKQPIKWRVLSVSGDQALLLADKCLDAKVYNEFNSYHILDDMAVTWETSTIRAWLNGYIVSNNTISTDTISIDYTDDNFINTAFTKEERGAIQASVLANKDNEEYGTEGGNDTTDKIFLLSLDDLYNENYGFTDSNIVKENVNNCVLSTKYADLNGSPISYAAWHTGNSEWLLRSPGDRESFVSFVYPFGSIAEFGYEASSVYAIRPALLIDLSNLLWKKAGMTGCYQIERDSNGGITGLGYEPLPLLVEQEALLPYPCNPNPILEGCYKKGYIFTGWSNEENATNDILKYVKNIAELSGSIKLYAQWAEAQENQFGVKAPRLNEDGYIVWDCIEFGSYFQTDTNGDDIADREDDKEKIKWRVLSISDNKALLLADKALDYKPFNSEWGAEGITWENCTLRSWLNGYNQNYNKAFYDYSNDSFILDAFTEEEQSAIISEEDKIFLLSLEDITNTKYGFSWDTEEQDGAKTSYVTPYAKNKGAYESTNTEYIGSTDWWLRSSNIRNSKQSDYVSVVAVYRAIYSFYNPGYSASIRPALYLDLSNTSLWKEAGVVLSNGVAYEDGEPIVSVNSVNILYNNQSISANGITVSENSQLQLTARVLPVYADNTAVTWTSADESIAVVSSNGLVTAVGAGTTMITVTTEDGGYTDSCKITVGNVGEPGKPGSPSENEPDSPSENEPGTPSENESGNTKHEVTVISGSQGAVAVDTKVSVSISADDIGVLKDNSFSVKVTDGKDIVLGITPYEDYSVSEIKVSDGTDALSLADILIAGNVGQKSFVSGNIILTASGNGIIGTCGCGYSLTLQGVSSNCTVEVSFCQTSYPIEISGESSEEAKSFENIKVMDGKVVDTVSGKELESLPLPEKDGMIFEGWYTKDGQEVTIQNLAEIAKEKQEITAKWSYLNVVVKQKVDITGLINLTDSESQKVKKYQVIYQNAKNTKYASVSTKGILTAKKADTNGRPVTVKVEALDKYKNILGSCYVTIVGTGMDKYKTDTLTHIGETFDMNTVITNLPSNGYDSIVWSVPKNCKYAVIDAKSGMLTALDKSGKVKVTAEFINSYDGVKPVKISTVVTIKLPKQSVKKATVKTSKSKTLKLSNLTTQKVTWSVDNTSVIAISSETGTNNGKGTNSVVVSGIAPGPAKVTAIVDGDESHPYVYEITIK